MKDLEKNNIDLEKLEEVVGGVDLSDDRYAQLLEVLIIIKKWGFPKRQLYLLSTVDIQCSHRHRYLRS